MLLELLTPINENRFLCWVNCSHLMGKTLPTANCTIQSLGRLDSFLFEKERIIIQYGDNISEVTPISWINDVLTLSYLWVIGTYEIVRTICTQDKTITQNHHNDFVLLKQSINRLRVPLAKMEPANKHKDTDLSIAYPCLNYEAGTSWHVSLDKYITRRELSDEFLRLLFKLKINKL